MSSETCRALVWPQPGTEAFRACRIGRIVESRPILLCNAPLAAGSRGHTPTHRLTQCTVRRRGTKP